MVSTHDNANFFQAFLKANSLAENQVIKYQVNDIRIFTHNFSIKNGNIMIGEEKVVEIEPPPPSETELLTDYIVDVDYRVIMIELGL